MAKVLIRKLKKENVFKWVARTNGANLKYSCNEELSKSNQRWSWRYGSSGKSLISFALTRSARLVITVGLGAKSCT